MPCQEDLVNYKEKNDLTVRRVLKHCYYAIYSVNLKNTMFYHVFNIIVSLYLGMHIR